MLNKELLMIQTELTPVHVTLRFFGGRASGTYFAWTSPDGTSMTDLRTTPTRMPRKSTHSLSQITVDSVMKPLHILSLLLTSLRTTELNSLNFRQSLSVAVKSRNSVSRLSLARLMSLLSRLRRSSVVSTRPLQV